jgi:hypothetical protein
MLQTVKADFWVYFSLCPTFNNDNEIYINGMFNNYSLTEFMDYNPKKGFMKKPFIKTRIYKF